MRISIAVIIVLSLASAAFGLPAYLQLFKKVEKSPENSVLSKAYCLTCHVKPAGGKLNPYGADFRKYGSNEAALRQIEPLDSDTDGITNKVEITAGSLPGDKAGKP